MQEIDKEKLVQSERVRRILQHSDGIVMIEKASNLLDTAPWLVRTLPKLTIKTIKALANHLKSLELDPDDSILSVTGFDSPPSRNLISLASAKSGSSISSLSQITKTAMASLPVIGPSIEIHNKKLMEELNTIELNCVLPKSKDDWNIVTRALQHSLAVHTFQESIWRPMVKEYRWPHFEFEEQKVLKEISALLQSAVELKELHLRLDTENVIKTIAESRKLDTVRTKLSKQKRHHSEELADAAVVAELSRSFSPDAQSALIKFAQIAGAAKFSRSARPSKMTQRQRRRRQEYLSAFDRCCRFIPCWILTTSQISDYLPAECLFDLVVIDESSQSDVTVLPGMMRGKQWLIVGDGKQVSPTEAFVSEENMENLRATLPDGPLEDALLPGRSFFDLCAQAFPRGRVVLHEHFRCAPEIINFSNELFYDGRLVPLRLPKKGDRFDPSIVDIKVAGGTKTGKVNEKEADKIVELVREMMISPESKSKPRSIGIISLIGDEQSRLIRGRLLDVCGPENLARHDVLIGDPPQFQGAERDVVFLSMVCSRQNCPTQNQQFHFQRANVALSRARDRVVLVRSIDLKHIPSLEDVKVPIIEFFMTANQTNNTGDTVEVKPVQRKNSVGREILEMFLREKGYQIVDMGTIWKNAFCVEHEASDTRIAILVDCEENQESDWLHSYSQQKAIERVGWNCLRVDALSIIVDYSTVLHRVTQFLTSHGIEEPTTITRNGKENSEIETQDSEEEIFEKMKLDKLKESEVIEIDDSSTEEERITEEYEPNEVAPEKTKSSADFDKDDTIEAWKFGEVVDLDFLRARSKSEDSQDDFVANPTDDIPTDDKEPVNDRESSLEDRNLKRPPLESSEEEIVDVELANESDIESDDKESSITSGARSQKRRKIPSYSRDGHDSWRRQSSESPQEENVDTDLTHEPDGESDGESNGKESSVTSGARSRKRRKTSIYSRDGTWRPNKDVAGDQKDDHWLDKEFYIQNDNH